MRKLALQIGAALDGAKAADFKAKSLSAGPFYSSGPTAWLCAGAQLLLEQPWTLAALNWHRRATSRMCIGLQVRSYCLTRLGRLLRIHR